MNDRVPTEELRTVLEAATPGELKVVQILGVGSITVVDQGNNEVAEFAIFDLIEQDRNRADAELFAMSRSLGEEVLELRAALDQADNLIRAVDGFRDQPPERLVAMFNHVDAYLASRDGTGPRGGTPGGEG